MQRMFWSVLAAGALMLILALGFGPPAAQAAGGTQIEPGRTFMLGGEQAAELMVRGRNAGGVAVEFLLLSNGKERAVATIEPGRSFELRVPARSTALFRNASERRAQLKFELSEEVGGLSMRYDGN